MMRQNRPPQSQYDGVELRNIDSRRESIQREEYSRFKRRQLRRTWRVKGEGQFEENEGERESYESYESYEPPSTSRGNDRLHQDLGATKFRNENDVRPGQGQPQSSEGERSSPDDDGCAGLSRGRSRTSGHEPAHLLGDSTSALRTSEGRRRLSKPSAATPTDRQNAHDSLQANLEPVTRHQGTRAST